MKIKKAISFVMAVVLLFSVGVSVFASDNSEVKSGSMKIINMNVDGLPIPSFLSSVKKSPIASANAIIDFLNGYDADLVMMQENFGLYPYYQKKLAYDNITGFVGGTGVGDGLGIASKYSLYNVKHIPWDTACGILNCGSDELTPKGFMVATAEIADGVYIDVYTIHADANEDDGSLKAKVEQFNQLCDYIDTYSKDRAVIVTGDFNSNFTLVLGDVLREKFVACGFKDTWVEVCNDGNYNFTYDEMYEKYHTDYWGHYDGLEKMFYRGTDTLTLEAKSHEYVFCTVENIEGQTVNAADHAASVVEMTYTVTETKTPDTPLEKEQAMSVTELCEKAVKYLFKALKLIISQIPGLIKGDIDIGWGK